MGTYAIGDIHGTSDALQTLLDLQLFSKEDTLVFLGDYVNKGPDVRGTLEQLIRVSGDLKTIFLRGNHEIMMMRSRSNKRLFANWMFSGGKETLASYGLYGNPDWAQKIPGAHWEFLEHTQPYFEKTNNIFVHAGLESGIPLARQHQLYLYWKAYVEPVAYAPGKIVICGHTARKNGLIAHFGHTTCLDTFAHGGQWLTCLEVETGKFWQTRKNGEVREGTLDQ